MGRPSDTFCILPWIHLSTRPAGEMRVCCTSNASGVGKYNDKDHDGQSGVLKNEKGYPANLNTTDLLTAWNNDYMRNVRLKMLAGEKPSSCLKCYKEEDAGHNSKRMWETDYWEKRVNIKELVENTDSEGGVEPKITYIDLRLGSKCQLACVMCSPHDSSGWVKDWKELDKRIQNENLKWSSQWNNKGRDYGASYNWHKNNTEFWNQLYDQIPHMQQLYFAGGESTIIEEHYTLLEEVINRGYAENIELRYNSNGVELPDRLFEIWKHYKKVRFHYSIDSIGDMNDYIRYPSNWNHQVEQFKILDSTSDNVEVTIACAIQALNIYYLPDLIKWKLEQNFKKINPWPFSAGMVNTHLVYWPPQLNVKVLPESFKAKVEKKYNKFYSWLKYNWHLAGAPSKEEFMNADYGIKRLQGLVSFMHQEDWSNRMPELEEYVKIMDEIRDTKFKDTFKEMADLW